MIQTIAEAAEPIDLDDEMTPTRARSRARSVFPFFLLGIVAVLVGADTLLTNNQIPQTMLLSGACGSLIFALFFSRRQFAEPLTPSLFLRGPHPFLLALIAWTGVATVAGSATVADLLRCALGVTVYFAAAYAIPSGPLHRCVRGALWIGLAVAALSVARLATSPLGSAAAYGRILENGAGGTALGSCLVALIPLAFVLALDVMDERKERLWTRLIAIILGGMLLATRNRYAWIAGAASLATLSWLLARFLPLAPRSRRNRGNSARQNRRRRLIATPLLAVVGAAALTGVVYVASQTDLFAGDSGAVTPSSGKSRGKSAPKPTALRLVGVERERAHISLLSDGSTAERIADARRLAGEIQAHPLRGSGPQKLDRGVRLENGWLFVAAESGLVGSALRGGAAAALLLAFLGALPMVRSGYRRTVLLGVTAGLVGMVVDGFGSSAATLLPGIATLQALILGIGVAACREMRSKIPALPAESGQPKRVGLAAGIAAITTTLVFLTASVLAAPPADDAGTSRGTAR